MTREELIKMCGSEEQANLAIDILLKNVKPAFVQSCIKVEIAKTEEKISDYKSSGFIYTSNGTYHTNWNKANELNGFSLSADQEKQYDDAFEKCNEAESLLYRKNRLTSLISVR